MLFKANKNLQLHRISSTSLALYIPKQEGFEFSFRKAGCNGTTTHGAPVELTGALGATGLPCEAEFDSSPKASWLHERWTGSTDITQRAATSVPRLEPAPCPWTSHGSVSLSGKGVSNPKPN